MDDQHQLKADLNQTLLRVQKAWSGHGAVVLKPDQSLGLCVLAAASEVTTGRYADWGESLNSRYRSVVKALYTSLTRRTIVDRAAGHSSRVWAIAHYNDSHTYGEVEGLILGALND